MSKQKEIPPAIIKPKPIQELGETPINKFFLDKSRAEREILGIISVFADSYPGFTVNGITVETVQSARNRIPIRCKLNLEINEP